MEKLKNILGWIGGGLFAVVFFVGGWIVVSWLYPDEWFAQIPAVFWIL